MIQQLLFEFLPTFARSALVEDVCSLFFSQMGLQIHGHSKLDTVGQDVKDMLELQRQSSQIFEITLAQRRAFPMLLNFWVTIAVLR